MDSYEKLMNFYKTHKTFVEFKSTLTNLLITRGRLRKLKKRSLETQFLALTQPNYKITEFVPTSMYKEFQRILNLILVCRGTRRKRYVAELQDYFLSFLEEILIFQ